MHESAPPSHDYLTLADIVGVYGIKGWVRLRIRLDDPNLLLSLPDLTLVAAPLPRRTDALTERRIEVDWYVDA